MQQLEDYGLWKYYKLLLEWSINIDKQIIVKSLKNIKKYLINIEYTSQILLSTDSFPYESGQSLPR